MLSLCISALPSEQYLPFSCSFFNTASHGHRLQAEGPLLAHSRPCGTPGIPLCARSGHCPWVSQAG